MFKLISRNSGGDWPGVDRQFPSKIEARHYAILWEMDMETRDEYEIVHVEGTDLLDEPDEHSVQEIKNLFYKMYTEKKLSMGYKLNEL